MTIGTVAINLSKTFEISESSRITVGGGSSVTPYFSRQRLFSPTPFEATLVQFHLNTAVVSRISKNAVFAFSFAAYATVLDGIRASQGFEGLMAGGTIGAGLTLWDDLQIGTRLEGRELIGLGQGGTRSGAYELTAFLQYRLSGSASHAETLRVELFTGEDGILRTQSGAPTGGTGLRLSYTVSF